MAAITELTQNPARAKEYFEDKLAFTTGPVEVSHKIEEGANVNIIDVRAAEDYQKGRIPGAVNLPKDQWGTFRGLGRDQINILYCYSQTCHLAASAAVRFADQGYPVVEMDGGFQAWKDNGLPVEK